MAHYKNYLRYAAYDDLGGKFPGNIVIFYYKGLGVTKAMFKAIDNERGKSWQLEKLIPCYLRYIGNKNRGGKNESLKRQRQKEEK